jgi:hypothetical protein
MTWLSIGAEVTRADSNGNVDQASFGWLTLRAVSRSYSQKNRRRTASATLLTLLALATPALATEIRGELALGAYHPAAQESKVPTYRWELENGVKEVLPDRVPARELAVVLTGLGAPKTPKDVTVPIRGGALLPSTVVVRTASTLVMSNVDDIGHEVYAVGLSEFSAEAIGPGAKRAINLGKAGNWPLLDSLTPHAHGHLHVIDDLITVATLTDDGKFVFTDTPAGKYTLHVFHGAQELATQTVEVGEQPLTLSAIALPQKK